MLHAGHSSTQVRSVITITGLGDHDQPDWLITMTGMRRTSHWRRCRAQLTAPHLLMMACVAWRLQGCGARSFVHAG